jgi:hypothetical protein
MSRYNRNYNNQKSTQQPTDGRKRPSPVVPKQAASEKIVYDELFPPLSASSTVSASNNPPPSTQVNIHLCSDCFDRFIF